MTVTNAAATVVRNPETGIKSLTLDLGLDSIVLLKRQGKFSVKNIASPSSFRAWLESSLSEGERGLQSSAQKGDLYGVEKLGWRLLTGDGLPKSLEPVISQTGWLGRHQLATDTNTIFLVPLLCAGRRSDRISGLSSADKIRSGFAV